MQFSDPVSPFDRVQTYADRLPMGADFYFTGLAETLLGLQHAAHGNSNGTPLIRQPGPVASEPIPALTLDYVARMINWDHASIHDAIHEGSLLAVNFGPHVRIPSWQFVELEHGHCVPGLHEVLRSAMGRLKWHPLGRFMSTPHESLSMMHRRSPVDWLHLDQPVDPVLRMLRGESTDTSRGAILEAMALPGETSMERDEAIQKIQEGFFASNLDLADGWAAVDHAHRLYEKDARAAAENAIFKGLVLQQSVMDVFLDVFGTLNPESAAYRSGIRLGHWQGLVEDGTLTTTTVGSATRLWGWQVDYSREDTLLPGLARIHEESRDLDPRAVNGFMLQEHDLLAARGPATPLQWLTSGRPVAAVMDLIETLPIIQPTNQDAEL